MPTSGPLALALSRHHQRVPTNETVQVKEVSVKVNPMRTCRPLRSRPAAASACRADSPGRPVLELEGPKRFSAKTRKIAVMSRLIQGLAANWLRLVAPSRSASRNRAREGEDDAFARRWRPCGERRHGLRLHVW